MGQMSLTARLEQTPTAASLFLFVNNPSMSLLGVLPGLGHLLVDFPAGSAFVIVCQPLL